jgi:HEAT repeat protein
VTLPRIPQKGRIATGVLWGAHGRVRSLAQSGDVEGLLALLDAPAAPDEEDEFNERALAACALGSAGTEASVRRLAALLGPEESVSVRLCAADGLRRIGGPAAAAAVITALGDDNWAVQYAAVKTLETTPCPEACPMLAALVTGTSHPLVRSTAAEALGEAKTGTWIPAVEAAARDASITVALGGINGLRRSESPAALAALQRLARSERLLRKPLLWLAARGLRRKLRRARARSGSIT